jgi:hypothetical protein
VVSRSFRSDRRSEFAEQYVHMSISEVCLFDTMASRVGSIRIRLICLGCFWPESLSTRWVAGERGAWPAGKDSTGSRDCLPHADNHGHPQKP